MPRPFRPATVRFGSPIDPHRYDGSRRECRRRITRDVMSAIGELSGQGGPAGLADGALTGSISTPGLRRPSGSTACLAARSASANRSGR